ncbi:MAG: tetraacyldisaccharide 4'-kinase [Gammaproteobacteria bacterium]|nr:tetraacyldisaccharide 4'-kinase [Gammaproteobacteria bacterium]
MHWLERHWYRKTPLSFLLLPLSWCYCLLMGLRRGLYRFGIFPTVKLNAPVIVVGNISVGGTGKTPLVIWLADFLRQQGMHPGIVLRGYGGSASHWPQLVTSNFDPDVVGDEAVMLARQSNCPVAADPDRVRAAQLLVREHQCDVIISDDGLQHLRLARDIEIAVIDGARRFGNGYCLPAGPLREPLSRLRDVSLRIVNGEAQAGELGMTLTETGLCRVNAPDIYATIGSFRGEAVHAVAGIGNPARFFAYLRQLGLKTLEHAFPDHHRFVARDIRFDDHRPVIMTQKDAVKCERFADDNTWYLAVEAKPDARVGAEILRRLQNRS